MRISEPSELPPSPSRSAHYPGFQSSSAGRVQRAGHRASAAGTTPFAWWLPTIPGYSFAVAYHAMTSVSGDFYDIRPLDDERVL